MSEIIISEQYKNAVELNQKIMITAQAAQQNLYDMCVMLKQMRDEKLYKELGYDTFEDYCKNGVGISYNYSYKLINAIDNVKNLESIQGLGATKLLLLATLSETQQEEIQQTVNLEDTSVRELKAEIEKLKTKADKADMLANQRDKAESKITQLETEIEELRNRQEMTPDQKTQDALIRRLSRELSEADQDHANNLAKQRREYQTEINKLKEQLEAQKNEVQTTVETVEILDMKEVFKAYYKNAIGAFNMMLEFIGTISEDKSFYIEKADALVSKFEKSLENMEV